MNSDVSRPKRQVANDDRSVSVSTFGEGGAVR